MLYDAQFALADDKKGFLRKEVFELDVDSKRFAKQLANALQIAAKFNLLKQSVDLFVEDLFKLTMSLPPSKAIWNEIFGAFEHSNISVYFFQLIVERGKLRAMLKLRDGIFE